MCPAPCDPLSPATPVLASDPQSCQSTSAGAVEVSLVTSKTPSTPSPTQAGHSFNPSPFVSVLRLTRAGFWTMQFLLRLPKALQATICLVQNPWSVTKPYQTNATTLTKRKPSYFQNSASASLITFAEIWYLVCLCQRDQPGMGREAPVLTRDWTVLRLLLGGGGGDFAWR